MTVPAAKQRIKRERVVGRLVKWNIDRGYGFVCREHGKDVFLSARDAFFSGLNVDDLRVGLKLSFVPWPDEKPGRADRAICIQIISGATP
jgi:cold shock CspA family protein